MKGIIIAYNEAMEQEIMDILQNNGIENYTKWEKVLGKGGASGPHLMTPVWPKANNVLFCVVSEKEAGGMLQDIRALRDKFRKEGIKAFQIPVEELT
jgi:hypothetical protein